MALLSIKKQMKSPQLENGYTRIANELLQQIYLLDISSRELRVIMFILRMTYGFKRKEAKITNTQISKELGIDRFSVSKLLSKLTTSNIVVKNDNILKLNKNYDDWIRHDLLSKMTTPKMLSKMTTLVVKNDNKHIYKENIKEKEIYKEKTKTLFTPLTVEERQRLCDDLKVSLTDVEFYEGNAEEWSISNNQKKANWYLTVRNWMRRDLQNGKLKAKLSMLEALEQQAKLLGFDVNDYA